jgi:hypothetical protein
LKIASVSREGELVIDDIKVERPLEFTDGYVLSLAREEKEGGRENGTVG